ncbi:hypothetical protein RV14_GL001392 [Enterococcus ratti]|uniref:Uncharacterized protein n=1 Tax=Enterococcus ratti TaxID=150033 RepID=A0A1L8WR50_9ENTE|nr:hypothetical protein RV14_GL001392 [Enterococcus ratti]
MKEGEKFDKSQKKLKKYTLKLYSKNVYLKLFVLHSIV